MTQVQALRRQIMKAITYERYGSPDVFRFEDVPKPMPKDDEVLIRIHATIAAPSDCAMRKADPFIVRTFTGLLRPKEPILGDAIAGEIEAIGDAVTRFKVGDQVFGTSAPASGTYAEYICLNQDGPLVTKPAGLSFAAAASLADGPITALPFLRDEAGVRAGQRMLVIGASGSVGSAAVQLGKHFGADVTGVCRTANVEMVRGLGADRVIDYAHENFAAEREAYDVVFDAVGKSSFSRCKAALKPGGMYLSTVPTLGLMLQMLWTSRTSGKKAKFAATGLRSAEKKLPDLAVLADLAASGRLIPVIDRHYPLAEMAEAHRYIETERKTGSVVIDVVPEPVIKLLAAA
jgi:NADPH:quinone reductase-like Zn-dependent oxidoreductase